MVGREMLIKEINGLPDDVIEQLMGIIRYVKIGVDSEYIPETNNEFYNGDHFKAIVSHAIMQHHNGKTVGMTMV